MPSHYMGVFQRRKAPVGEATHRAFLCREIFNSKRGARLVNFSLARAATPHFSSHECGVYLLSRPALGLRSKLPTPRTLHSCPAFVRGSFRPTGVGAGNMAYGRKRRTHHQEKRAAHALRGARRSGVRRQGDDPARGCPLPDCEHAHVTRFRRLFRARQGGRAQPIGLAFLTELYKPE